MDVDWKKWGRTVSMFLFSRYPIANALSFLMLLGERAKREKEPPIEPNTIYAHIGVLLGAGLAMGFNIRRREAAICHAVHLFVLAYTIQINTKLHYKDWLRAKMCLRMMGLAGYFFLYAFFTCPKPRPQYLRRTGETIIGVYCACFLYQLLQNPVEKEAFLKHALGGMISLYICSLLFATIALCYLPGLFVNDISQALLLVLWFVTTSVDCRMHYWTKRMGVDYWNQVRIIGDHFAMMLGCIMYITCTKKATYENYGPGQNDPDQPTMVDGIDEVDEDTQEQNTQQEASQDTQEQNTQQETSQDKKDQ